MPFQHVRSPIAAILSFGLIAVALSACGGGGQAQEAGGMQPQAASVEVQRLSAEPVELEESLSGRARAYQVSEVRPQVSGLIRERLFTEGAAVEAGDELYKIEDTEYRAAVNSAAASLQRAEARAEVARQSADRFERLVQSNAVSKQQYDEAIAAAREAEADVAMQRAALQTARTNLERTVIRAPISGQIGRSSVTPGALVTQNQGEALATIRQLDPMYVDLTASSTDMLKWRRDLAEGRIGTMDSGAVPVSLTLEDGSAYGETGQLAFSEVSIDETAGTVVIRATVPNPDNYILPGAYLRASLPVGTVQSAVLAPQAAVQRTPRGEPIAMVVGEGNVAEQRMLTVAGAKGNDWIVTEGLADGDRIIVSGLLNLRPDMPVNIVSGDTAGGEPGSEASGETGGQAAPGSASAN